MNTSPRLSSILFCSCIAFGAFGCAGTETQEQAEQGEVFDENGRADTASGSRGTNPGKLLLRKLAACDANAYGGDEGAAALTACYAKAVDAAGWTAEWRIQQDDASLLPGSIAGRGGQLAGLRAQWTTLCEGLDAAYQYGDDFAPGESYVSPKFHCLKVGELAIATAAVEFAYEYFDDLDALRSYSFEEEETEFTDACDAQRSDALQSFESAEAARDIYQAHVDCLKAQIATEAGEAQAYANRSTDEASTALQDAANTWFAQTHALCVNLIVAAQYKVEANLSETDGDILGARCEATFAQPALFAINALRSNAGGSFGTTQTPSN